MSNSTTVCKPPVKDTCTEVANCATCPRLEGFQNKASQGKIKSILFVPKIKIQFTNKLKHDLMVYWIDYQGKEV